MLLCLPMALLLVAVLVGLAGMLATLVGLGGWGSALTGTFTSWPVAFVCARRCSHDYSAARRAGADCRRGDCCVGCLDGVAAWHVGERGDGSFCGCSGAAQRRWTDPRARDGPVEPDSVEPPMAAPTRAELARARRAAAGEPRSAGVPRTAGHGARPRRRRDLVFALLGQAHRGRFFSRTLAVSGVRHFEAFDLGVLRATTSVTPWWRLQVPLATEPPPVFGGRTVAR